MHHFQALSWEKPAVPMEHFISKVSLCWPSKHDFRDRKVAEAVDLPQKVADLTTEDVEINHVQIPLWHLYKLKKNLGK